jgi:hypothetical protein
MKGTTSVAPFQPVSPVLSAPASRRANWRISCKQAQSVPGLPLQEQEVRSLLPGVGGKSASPSVAMPLSGSGTWPLVWQGTRGHSKLTHIDSHS